MKDSLKNKDHPLLNWYENRHKSKNMPQLKDNIPQISSPDSIDRQIKVKNNSRK